MNLVATVAIKLEARAGAGAVAVVGADNFDQALEAAESRRPFIAQVKQHLIVRQRRDGRLPGRRHRRRRIQQPFVIDDYRRACRQRMRGAAMRHEGQWRDRPQHAVKTLRGGGVRAGYRDAQALRTGLGRKAAGDIQFVADMGIKINPRH